MAIRTRVVAVVCVVMAFVPRGVPGQQRLGDLRLLGPAPGPPALLSPEPGGLGPAQASPDVGLTLGPASQPLPGIGLDPSECPPQHGAGRPFMGFFQLPEERYRGPGEPLVQESWQFRPLSVGTFFGFLQGGALVRGWTYEEQGTIAGLTLGWDFHHYFGAEMRVGFGRVVVGDTMEAILAQQTSDDTAGLSPYDPARRRFDVSRYDDLIICEINALYYPWGDSRWRPYAMIGMGVTSIDFIDRSEIVYHGAYFTLPIGVGVKYLNGDWLAFRLELADQIMFGGGSPIETVNRLCVTAGVELRFGGSNRRAYWPWNPGRNYW